MKVTAKTEYGVRAMIEIARKNGQPAKVNEIARKQNMPERFLEQVMASLKKEHLVKSIRGAHGGYILANNPGQITLKQIIQALEGQLALVECLDEDSKCLADSCTIKNVWIGVQSVISEALDSITVKQLAENKIKDRGKYAGTI